MDLETRIAAETWRVPGVELRAVPDDDHVGLRFSGYAAVFDSPSEPLPGPRGMFRERIAPSAFTKTLRDRKDAVRLFWNHDTSIPLASTHAKTTAGSLTLTADGFGLRADAVFLPERRMYAADVEAGVVDSMSFAFTVDGRGESWSDDGSERTLTAVRLHEVSVVSGWPAYPSTSASVRSLAEEVDAEPDDLAAAFTALRDTEHTLTAEQHDLLMRLINTRSDAPVVGARLATWRQAFAARAATA